jgi:hypothetical protein
MPTSITKYAPQVILLAVALYWSWPSLMQSMAKPAVAAAANKGAATTGEFSAAVLSPKFAPIPTRNPFEMAGTAHSAKGKKRGAKAAAELAAAEAKDSGLVLNGTCIMGQQRLALINGHVYREKEVIPGKGGDDSVDWVVTDILPHKVMLLYQGTPLQLSYSNVTSGRDAAKGKSPSPDKRSQKSAK